MDPAALRDAIILGIPTQQNQNPEGVRDATTPFSLSFKQPMTPPQALRSLWAREPKHSRGLPPPIPPGQGIAALG